MNKDEGEMEKREDNRIIGMGIIGTREKVFKRKKDARRGRKKNEL